MFELRAYQKETIEILRGYLDAARFKGAQGAFDQMTRKLPPNARNDYQPLAGLEETPIVCLRLPTGGGKTVLAAYSVGVAANAFFGLDSIMVLWLVPTNTIRTQTLETLKNPDHPNNRALYETFGDRFLVIDIADFEILRPQDVRGKTCVVVGTMATLRVNSTEGRRVYAHNENLEPHFVNVPDNVEGLERIEEGADKDKIKFSFRNLISLNRPLVILDEAHNDTSPLSVEVLQRVNSACIIEFTATPALTSNILHYVTAAELKAKEMIKLPIILTQHQSWQEAIDDSILTRQKLHDLARTDKDFIHPIVLIQAEDRDQEVTYEVIRDYLINEAHITPERIAVATGNQRELDKVNLMDPKTQVEFVITVQALKEGWDCPFAYVFCSVATIHSKKDVEQLLGRVLRMPYAKRRDQEDLNRAYAHVSSVSWPQAVNQLCDRLVSMGFDEQEAEQAIQTQMPLSATKTAPTETPLQLTLREKPDLTYLTVDEQANITVISTQGKQVMLQVRGKISDELEKKLLAAVPALDRDAAQRTIAVHRRHQHVTPSERGETFAVPQLCLWIDDELELVEKELFLGASGLDLLAYPPELTEGDFSIREKADSFEIDLLGEQLTYRHIGSQTAFDPRTVTTEWTDLQLSRWLDEKLRDRNIRQEVLLEFIRRTIAFLTTRRNIPLTLLVRARPLVQKALSTKIEEYKKQAFSEGFQQMLFGDNSQVETSYEYAFKFKPNGYAPREMYKGRYQFNKHFYPLIGEFDNEEELLCAQAIDRCEQVKHWVRNYVSFSSETFRLLTSTDYFYPDFVAELKDGRVLVVEYKGEHLIEYEAEKRNIGERWEEKSGGKAIFLWAVKRDEQRRDVFKQVEDKVTEK